MHLHKILFFISLFIISDINFSIAQMVWEKHPGNPVIHSWSGNKNDPSDYSYTIEPSIIYDSVKNIYHCWFLSKTNRQG
jgi:hypothetical protein